MKYKALLMDVDGTLAPISYDNSQANAPSPKVQAAIEQAKAHIQVGVITARPSYALTHFLPKLQLNCPSILINGAEVIDPKTLAPLWRQSIDSMAIQKILSLAQKHKFSVLASDFTQDLVIKPQNKIDKNLADIYFENVPVTLLPEVEQALKNIPEVIYHRIPVEDPNYAGVDITNKNVSKQHAVVQLAKMLRISPAEIIGVGDSYNDFPLLMACGLKIAMGNAVDELKAIANFVCPSVDEDGVATVIEKFILNQ